MYNVKHSFRRRRLSTTAYVVLSAAARACVFDLCVAVFDTVARVRCSRLRTFAHAVQDLQFGSYCSMPNTRRVTMASVAMRVHISKRAHTIGLRVFLHMHKTVCATRKQCSPTSPLVLCGRQRAVWSTYRLHCLIAAGLLVIVAVVWRSIQFNLDVHVGFSSYSSLSQTPRTYTV